MITAVPSIALTVGANRIVRGVAIPTPIGKPDEEPNDEYAIRMAIFKKALEALSTPVDKQTVFNVD